MTAAKWLPGPWFVHDYSALYPGQITVSCDDPAEITVANVRSGASGTPAEALANAHLIAAAPELYDGLGELLDDIETGLIASASSHSGRDDEDFLSEFPEDYERCKRLRGLLAKARGETP